MFMRFLLGLISPSKSIGCLMQVAIYNPIDILGKMAWSIYQGHEALFPRYPPQLVGRCVGHGGTCDDWQGRGGGHSDVCGTSPSRLASLTPERNHSFWNPLDHSTLMQTQVLSCAFHPVWMCIYTFQILFSSLFSLLSIYRFFLQGFIIDYSIAALHQGV